MTPNTPLPSASEILDELAGLAGGIAGMLLPIAVMTPGALAVVILLAIPVVALLLGALLAALVGGPLLLLRTALRLRAARTRPSPGRTRLATEPARG